MGTQITLKKGDVSIDLGRLSGIVPVGVSYDDLNNEASRENIIEILRDSIKRLEKDIETFAAYTPKDVEDLSNVKMEIREILMEIVDNAEMLRMLYFVGPLIDEDGYKVTASI